MSVCVYIRVYKCMCCRETKERKRESEHEEKERKGVLESVFPCALKAQYTQTVKCFHRGHITAWQNVVLFRVEREGPLDERGRKERERRRTHK